jgi:hypothetical protein
MANMAKKKSDPRLARAGVAGFNKPKRTPSHPTKSHVVVAKEGSQVKTIRFGQQGVTGDKTAYSNVKHHSRPVTLRTLPKARCLQRTGQIR